MNDYMRYEVEIRQGSTSQKTTPYDTDPRPYIRIEKELMVLLPLLIRKLLILDMIVEEVVLDSVTTEV